MGKLYSETRKHPVFAPCGVGSDEARWNFVRIVVKFKGGGTLGDCILRFPCFELYLILRVNLYPQNLILLLRMVHFNPLQMILRIAQDHFFPLAVLLQVHFRDSIRSLLSIGVQRSHISDALLALISHEATNLHFFRAL